MASKPSAPTKKSLFERSKAEAEAKKARAEAETAAALREFEASFDDDSPDPFNNHSSQYGRGAGYGGRGGREGGAGGGMGAGRRHFTSGGTGVMGMKSGPGSLGPSLSMKSGPGSLGSAPGSGLGQAGFGGRKRGYDDYTGRRDRDQGSEYDRDSRDRKGMYAYDDAPNSSARRDTEDRFDVEETKAAARPTLHLSSLPPGTSPAVIKGLFAPSPLDVEDVRILPRLQNSSSERNAISAIVTLAAETPATDIDTMVSHLQNRYLGFGFNLSISRHLSSAALTGTNSLLNAPSAVQNLPFGAKVVQQHTSLSRAPPPGQQGRFAPPASYTSSTPYGSRSSGPPTQVNVHIPSSLKQIRLIHKTIEALLTYGPEFEALLMSRPSIQRDEAWSWLWDSKSTGGVYYRWRLWEILTNAEARRRKQQEYSTYNSGRSAKGEMLFEGQSSWVPPEDVVKFEYTTSIEQFISDDDYNSSDEEDFDDNDKPGGGLAGRYRDHQRVGTQSDVLADSDGQGYLNPLAKTKLVHLMARLPETNAKLRKGDVARVTGFAIEHSGAGADEVAEMIVRNVVEPLRFSVKKPKDEVIDRDEDSEVEDGTPKVAAEDVEDSTGEKKDTTPSSLIALYLISDILSASSTSGVRHAWRYRSLIQQHLLQQKTFETLGRLPRKNSWGKLRAEKWKRQVQVVLNLWEGWCVFEEAVMKGLIEGFLEPPLTEEEKNREEERVKVEAEREKLNKIQSKWRSMDEARRDGDDVGGRPMAVQDSDVDMDGTPMADDDDDDDDETASTDENLDGVSMVDSSDEETEDQPVAGSTSNVPQDSQPAAVGELHQREKESAEAAAKETAQTQQSVSLSQGRRARPKAADFDDMFE
jgi:U2-associated protein SR140